LVNNRNGSGVRPRFAELDYRSTPIGNVSLRRRFDLRLHKEVYEIKLDEDFLMSSAFIVSEVALAELSLGTQKGDNLDVVVGGLGLGFTASAVLANRAVRSLIVVEFLEPVIDWHRSAMVPLGVELTSDRRCRFVLGDFFKLVATSEGFDEEHPSRKFDAVLVDIDHTPEAVLDPANASFYTERGLNQVAAHLKPGGIFGLWSNDPPNEMFEARLKKVFPDARGVPVCFHNPIQNTMAQQTVYLGSVVVPASIETVV
jgi:spermidine synthase